MSYLVDSSLVSKHLAEFLTRAKDKGFSFMASLAPAGGIPKLIIQDVSNQMTWAKDPYTGAVTFSLAGIAKFHYGSNDPQLLSILSTNIDPASISPAFYIPRNGNLFITDAVLVEEWKSISSKG